MRSNEIDSSLYHTPEFPGNCLTSQKVKETAVSEKKMTEVPEAEKVEKRKAPIEATPKTTASEAPKAPEADLVKI